MRNKLIFSGIVSVLGLLPVAQAQIVGTDAYIIANSVEIGIAGSGGFEGADTNVNPNPVGSHFRSNTQYFGFVANPQLNAWLTFDGDFFTPGTPENGWGIEMIDAGGVSANASNNRANPVDMPGTITDWQYNNGCYSADWEGDYNQSGYDLHILVNYQMEETELFYTTNVTVTNNGGVIPDFYYYRNLDPDNNIITSGSYTTQNTIVSQPDPTCSKALVSATQATPAPSYLGLAAIGDDFRVCYGGFSNRDASNLWTGTGFTQAVGATNFADEAIALAYRYQNFQPGETITFKFVVILDATQADNALNKLFYFNYIGSIGGPAPLCTPSTDTAIGCSGLPLQIELEGTAVNDFTWTWSPPLGLDTTAGTIVVANPGAPTLYTVTGTPLNPCFTTNITQDIYVSTLPGPDLQITDPGPQCISFDLADLVFTDANSVPGTTVAFYTDPPINATDNSDLFTGTTIFPGDSVYLAILDPVGGCIDYELIVIDWQAGFSFDVVPVLPNCLASDGSLEVINIVGASGAVDFDWSNGATTALNGGIPAGTYSITMTDAGGCTVDTIINLPNQTTLTSNVVVNVFAECGLPTGQITVSGSAGTPSYGYELGGVSNTTGIFTGLTDSLYVIEITDAAGCLIFDSIIVPDTSTIAINLISTSPEQCGNGAGSLVVGGTGGGTPYTFTLGTTTQSSGTFTGLNDGTYNVIVTDLGGCDDTIAVTITDTPTLTATLVDTTSASCGLSNGEVVVTASNAGPTYNFTIGTTTQTTGNFTGLAPGSYNMTVTSGTCTQNVAFVIADIDNLVTTLVDTNEQICDSDGDVSVVIASGGGGTGTFSVPGFGSNSTGNFTLPAGSYTMTITSGTCVETEPFTIGYNPGALALSVSQIIAENCGLYNGQITTAITGVTGNPSNVTYTINSTPASDGIFTGLGDGIYVMYAEDENGCNDTTTATVAEIPLTIDLGPDAIYCISATLTTNAVGSSYQWTFLDTVPNITYNTQTINVTESGTYSLEVFTAECYATDTIDIQVFMDNFVVVPNVFTPNGDNINETFKVSGLFVNSFHISIFNRWGQLLFTSDDINNSWDGKFNGKPADEGTYMFIITYFDPCQNPSDQTVTGTLQLFR